MNNIIHAIRHTARAATVLLLALLTAQTAWAWSGEGTESSPYKISNADDFTKFSNIVNGTNGETRNTSAWGTLTANIRMTGISCSPIGDYNNPYAGTFDGAGHTVEGIILNGNSNIGLFGVVANGGTVQGITLTNSNISGRNPVGGIAGMNWGTITNCHVTNTVSITGTYLSAAVGGIAGMNGYGTGGHNGRVYGCTSAAGIQGTGNSSCVGGIVGNCNASTITDCIAIGAIVNSPQRKGAIVGNMVSSTLSNNYYNDCKVNSSDFTASGVGIGSESNSSQKDAEGRVEPVFCIAAGNDVIMTSSGAATTDYGTNGIKVYSNYLYYNGAFYAKSSASVAMTLGHEEREGYIYSNTYSASDGTFSGSGSAYTLTMPDEDVIVSIARYDLHSFGYTDTYHPDGTTNPYVISDVDGWNLFCDCLNDNDTWNRFSGKTVNLGDDITVSRMAGSGNNPFCGNFDGGGNTLTFTATAADNYCAPFVGVKGGTTADDATTISNLNVVTTITANDYRHMAGLIALQWGHVNVSGCNATVNISSTVGDNNPHDLYPAALVSQASSSDGGTLTVTGCTASGTISTDGKYAAGLVGIVQGTATISDCLVSVTIQSSKSGDGTHGGIVAALSGVTNIYGTVFNGRLLGEDTESVGGFIGWRNKGANIYNSLFIPTEVTVKKANSATFARNDVDTHNCYYTYYLCDGEHYVPYYATDGITRRNGHAPHTVTADADVTIGAVALTGTATQYDVSGITAYSGGGLQLGQTLYYGSGDQLSLTLSNTATGAPQGYQYDGYTASAGTLSGTTLTMPDADVTITVSTDHLASTGQPVAVAYVDADGTLHDGDDAAQAVALDGTETSLGAYRQEKWYFVGIDFSHTGEITCYGDVHIILCDGKTMTVDGNGSYALWSPFGNFYFYGQNGQTGTLNATGRIDAADNNAGTLTINGGIINATGDYGISAYGLIINRGTVNATGNDGHGIWSGGNITLGWNKPTDRISITASSYYGTVQVADGKKLHNGSGFLGGTLGDPAADVNGKTLRPAATATYTTADGTADTADAILLDASDNSLPAGNYLATGTLNYTHGITLTGNVTLILADNCHMNVGTSGSRISGSNAIYYSNYATLTITSEANGNGNGALSVYTKGTGNDAIFTRAITINGGHVTADTNGDYALALGAFKDLTINGGTVTATTTGTGAHAIYAHGNFNYNGGNVTATAPNDYAIYADGNYTFSWRTPADRITIGATGLYAPAAKTATFTRLFTDATGNYYGATLTGDELNALAGKTLQPVTAINLTAREAPDGNFWTTYYNGTLGFTIDNDENACAYTATYGDGKLTLHKLGKEIPKNTAVIIVAENNVVSMTATTDLDDFTDDNDLHGVDVDTDVDDLGTGTFYVLGMTTVGGDQHFGFHRYTGSMMAAHKAFVFVSGSQSARSLTMVFDEASGIESLTPDAAPKAQAAEHWFTLDGRKLQGKPTKSGIYVNNGRKVVIK